MRAGFVFIGNLYTNSVKDDCEIIPPGRYTCNLFREREKVRAGILHAFPPSSGPNFEDPLSLPRPGGVTEYSCGERRRNARSGCTIEVAQTNGQSRKLAVGSGPSCKSSLLFAVTNENLKMLAQNFDDRNFGRHFLCRAGPSPSNYVYVKAACILQSHTPPAGNAPSQFGWRGVLGVIRAPA